MGDKLILFNRINVVRNIVERYGEENFYRTGCKGCPFSFNKGKEK